MKTKSYALPLAMMFLLYFFIAFTSGLNNPFAKVIQTQFTLDTFQSQFGNLAFFLAYFLAGIPASLLVTRVGYKRAALVALAVMFAGVWVVFAGGNLGAIWLYLAGMFVLGCAITVLQVVVNPMVTALGSKEKANSRMNFSGAASSFGAAFAPLVVGFIIGNVAVDKLSVSDVNPLLYIMSGLLVVVFAVLYVVQIPDVGISHSAREKNNYRALLTPNFIFGLLAIFLYVGLEVSTANITNLYMLNALHIDAGVAGAIVGSYWLLMLVGRLIGAAVGTKLQSRPQLISVAAIGLMLYLTAIFIPTEYTAVIPAIDSEFKLLFSEVPVSILLFVLAGLCNSVMWSCIFILATEGLGRHTNLASGVFMMMVFGGGIIPALQGSWVDSSGSFISSYWVGVICLAVILIYAIIAKKNR
ncbi:MAG: MFS transporter [Prevotellaceae bacterium]|jgi:FHS family L-fucose permease-like MFS transporter|nr:MFS transporter [Prevotellaceae bacterium]